MRLLLVELTRFRARRAIVLLLLAAALLTVVVAGATAWDTRPLTDADVAAAEQQARDEASQPYVREQVEECEEDPEEFGATTVEDCVEMMTPQAEWYLWRSELSLEEQRQGAGTAVAALLLVVAAVVGATFAGADWASGSMSNQLLFEARRRRVWTAKALAVTGATALVALVVLTGVWTALTLVAELREISTPPEVTAAIRGDVLRATALAGAAALGGFALSMLLRSTVATVAVLFVVSVAGEIVVNLLPLEGRVRWSPSANVLAVLGDGTSVYDPSLPCGPGTVECGFLRIELLEGVLYLGVALALVLVLSLWSYRRRDVA